MKPKHKAASLVNLAAAQEARQRITAATRRYHAPRVRDLHAQGFCVSAIVRRAGLSETYVRWLLRDMGLKPHPAASARPASVAPAPPAPAGPAHAGGDEEQSAFHKAGAQACVAHFRDLVAAYPGRKLASLPIPEAYAPTRFYAPFEPPFSSQAALCLEGATAVFR